MPMSEENSRFPGPAAFDPEKQEAGDSSSDGDAGRTTAGSVKNNDAPAVLRRQDDEADTESPLGSSKEDEEGQHQTPEAGGGQQMSRSKNVLITIALCLATFLAALDMTIITTALPTIVQDFQASAAGFTWIGSGYLLAAAASTPSWGKVSDIFGRKPILLAANVTFFVGSLLCALSVDTQMLVGSRVIQGIGGGGLLLLTSICISDLFSIRSRSVYLALLGLVWGVAGGVGPVFGGLLTQLVTWRWCFYINLPLDGIALVITFLFLEIHTPKTPLLAGLRAIDWLGCVTIVGGTVMFLLGLEYGGTSFPWSSPTVICLIVFGVLVLAIFVIIEWKISRYPVMPIWLFAHRSTVSSYVTGGIHAAVYMSGSYYLPLYFQVVLGATPLQSGIYLLPLVLSLSAAQLLAGLLARKLGQSTPFVWLGTSIALLGQGLYISYPSYISWPRLVAFQIISGIGQGPNFHAIVVSLQSYVRPNDIATATSTFYFLRNIANSVSVVIGGVIFSNQANAELEQLRSVVPAESIAALQHSFAGATIDVVKALPEWQRLLVLDAYLKGLKTMWIFYTAVAAIGMITSFLMGTKKLTRDHEVTKTGLEVQEQDRKERLQRERQKKEAQKANDTKV